MDPFIHSCIPLPTPTHQHAALEKLLTKPSLQVSDNEKKRNKVNLANLMRNGALQPVHDGAVGHARSHARGHAWPHSDVLGRQDTRAALRVTHGRLAPRRARTGQIKQCIDVLCCKHGGIGRGIWAAHLAAHGRGRELRRGALPLVVQPEPGKLVEMAHLQEVSLGTLLPRGRGPRHAGTGRGRGGVAGGCELAGAAEVCE